jgi:hypothetical protein
VDISEIYGLFGKGFVWGVVWGNRHPQTPFYTPGQIYRPINEKPRFYWYFAIKTGLKIGRGGGI